MLERAYVKNKYGNKSDIKASLHICMRFLFHIILIYYSYIAIESNNYFLGILLMVPHLITFSFLGWAGIGHELFHKTVFKSRKYNIFFMHIFAYLTWSNIGLFRATHKYHHKYTLHDDDLESRQVKQLKINDTIRLLSFDYIHFYRLIKNTLLNSIGKISSNNKAYELLFPISSSSRLYLIKSAREILFFQISMAIIFLVFMKFWLILVVNFAPFFFTFLNRVLAISQHYGFKYDKNQKMISRTIILNYITRFFYAGMNYHIEHHMYPEIPFYNLSKLHNEIQKESDYPKENIANGLPTFIYKLYKSNFFGNEKK